jgi:CRISPR type IV-associated protein Csf2
MTTTNNIQGIFRLNSPLHCALPEENKAEKNYTKTVFQEVMTRTSGPARVPYFPGNDMRGRLRRKAAAIVLDHITSSEKVTPELYAGLTTGAVSAAVENTLSVEEALRASANVYIGLFGGGVRLLRSRFQTGDLVPVLETTIDAGMVPAHYGQTDDENFLPVSKWENDGVRLPLRAYDLLQDTMVVRVDDLQRMLRPDEVQAYIENPAQTVAAYQAARIDQRLAKKTAKAEGGEAVKKQDTSNFLKIQSIMAGTSMFWKLGIDDDASDAHVGLLLLALEALVQEQKLGGWCRAGMGRFDATLTLTRNGEKMPVFASSRASDEAELSSMMQPFVDAAKVAIADLSATSLMEFFLEREPKKPAKKTDKLEEQPHEHKSAAPETHLGPVFGSGPGRQPNPHGCPRGFCQNAATAGRVWPFW